MHLLKNNCNNNLVNIDISIIIVSWNAINFLRQCMDSVYNTINIAKFEVIVVDNDSSDNSPEMVKNEFPNVKLICTGDNLGFAKANNIGIKRSSGKYLCLINSDTKVLKGSIDSMISYMAKHPNIGLLGPKLLNPDLTNQPSCNFFPTVWNTLCQALYLDKLFARSKLFGSYGYLSRFGPYDKVCRVEVIVGTFWIVRREALDKIGLLDEDFFMYGEDIDWCKRFWMAGWDVVYYPHAEVIHYVGGSSLNAPVRFYIELKRSNLLYWKKYYGRLGNLYIYFSTFIYEIIRIIGGIIFYIIKPSERRNVGYKTRRSIACLKWLINVLKLK